jgi:hypothetical protein
MSRRNSIISGQFAARLIEMLESPAYRALSESGHRIISRIEIELGHHGGNDNGRLPITFDQFVEYGIYRTAVAPAIREAEALGFIRVTVRGRGGNAEHRKPNMFCLTFAYSRSSREPTHDWRRIKTLQEAKQMAHAARQAKDQRAVALGKRSRQKKIPVAQTATETGSVNRNRKHQNTGCGYRNHTLSTESATTSISGAGGRNGRH